MTFAVPVGEVGGVDVLGAVARVPDAPRHLRGIVNRAGAMLPVFDLAALAGLPEGDQRGTAWLVVLRAGPLVGGFGADGEPNIVAPADETDAPEPRAAPPVEAPFVQAPVRLQDGRWAALLHAETLLRTAAVEEPA